MNRKGNKTESFEGNFVVRDWWELFFEVPTISSYRNEPSRCALLAAAVITLLDLRGNPGPTPSLSTSPGIERSRGASPAGWRWSPGSRL
jgi:hypothetical protein